MMNPVIISVLVMSALCLLKVNVMISILIAAVVAGLMSPEFGIGIKERVINTFGTLIGGMGGNSETALSYVLLGSLATAISMTDLVSLLAINIGNLIKDKRKLLVLALAGIACFSQNLVPIHIAFIPILIPPLLSVMNNLKIDRRAVACALTFGLKAPYLTLPFGFGAIFHGIVAGSLTDNGVDFAMNQVWKATIIPGLGMVVGLFLAVFVFFAKPREYEDRSHIEMGETKQFGRKEVGALIGLIATFAAQLFFDQSLPIGALVGLVVMTIFGVFKVSELDDVIAGGIKLMGFIAFVMLVAAGYGAVIRATGGVETLVANSAAIIGGSKLVGAFVMLLIGLVITMGIGTSFGTIPVIATIYVPLGLELGFTPMAIACLVAVAGALGDAGSPASDSTLGPTSGLNADGQHDHIRDTCIPTFICYNIPLIISGVIAAVFVL
ncbi:MAG: Na+/H+ antiporter family protein [Tissierellia bacterium]|nr:Na+/H+ antiporter family protein [Tissierellia bacterium]